METANSTGVLLSEVVQRTGYVHLLGRHLKRIGIRVNGEAFLLNVHDGKATALPQGRPANKTSGPVYWVECSRSALEAAKSSDGNVAGVAIKCAPGGQSIEAGLERLLLRCFQAPPFPLDDREELIYPALFGFTPPPTIFWESKKNVLRVLRYGSCLVTSGLSEPWFRKPQLFESENVSGVGYELLMKSTDPRVCKEFVSLVEYLEGGGDDIALGNWLEFEAGQKIPGTDISGFLVVKPSDLAPSFPVGSSRAYWHELTPISALELDAAKCYSAFKGELIGVGDRKVDAIDAKSRLEKSRRTLEILSSLPDVDA